eukprot:489806_1
MTHNQNMLLVLVLLLHCINALSVCDDIDVTFIIDQDTVVNNLDNLITFIDGIIEDGSSEHSAFSVVLYGDDMPAKDIGLLSIELSDTFGKHRSHKSSTIKDHLINVFSNITAPIVSTSPKISVSLDAAFIEATKQSQPTRNYAKKTRFATEKYKKHKIGARDDNKVYFIFDNNDKLLKANGDENMCKLFEFIDGKDTYSIHFIYTQKIQNIKQKFNELCGGKEHLLHEDLFFALNNDVFLADEYDENFDAEDESPEEDEFYDFNTNSGDSDFNRYITNMDEIYPITCPSKMEHPQYGGHLHLSPHAQWIDPTTINKCSLSYNSHRDQRSGELVDVLDSTSSYIYVNNHYHDDNTFKVGDFLIAEPTVYDQLKHIGCFEPIYKIEGIKHIKKVTQHHDILKLSITEPKSPMEYIWTSDLKLVKPETHPHARMDTKPNKPTPTPRVGRRLVALPPSDSDESVPLITRTMTQQNYKQYTKLTKQKKTGYFKKQLLRYHAWRSKSKKLQSQKDVLALSHSIEVAQKNAPPRSEMEETETIIIFDNIEAAKLKLKKPETAITGAEKKAKDGWKTAVGIDTKDTVTLDTNDENAIEEAGSKSDADHAQHVYQKKLFKYKKTHGETDKAITSGWENEKVNDFLTVTAQFTGTVTYKTEMLFESYFQGIFQWKNLFKSLDKSINIRFQIVGTAEAKAEFVFEGTAKLGLKMTLPFEIGTYILLAGPVPIIIKPYVVFEAGLELADLNFKFDLHCHYKEQILVGYQWVGKKPETKTVWEWDWTQLTKGSLPSYTTKEYKALPSKEDENAVELLEPDPDIELEFLVPKKEDNGFYFERVEQIKKCTGEVAIYNEEKKPCKLKFGIKKLWVEPRVGVQLYTAFSLEAGLRVNVPIVVMVDIVDAPAPKTCQTKKADFKSGGADLKAFPKVDIELSGVAAVKVKLPRLFWGIKEFFVIKKIATAITDDLKALIAKIESFDKLPTKCPPELIQLKAIYDKFGLGITDLNNGEKAHALKKFGDGLTSLKTTVNQLKDQVGNDIATWRDKIVKHQTDIEGVITRVESIVKNPFKMEEKTKPFTTGKKIFPIIIGDGTNCWSVPKIISDLIKKSCCPGGSAHDGNFADWYDGYDRYNDETYLHSVDYNKYNNRYTKNNAYLHSAPVYEQQKQSNKPFLTSNVIIAIFAIFIIMTCIAGCICLVCGAFISYNFNKYKLEKKVYNQLYNEESNI